MNLIIRPVIIIAKMKNSKKKRFLIFYLLSWHVIEVRNDVSHGGFVPSLWQT